jgi:molybdopterin-guanine dinucleotide biosynthesis protein B
MRVIGLAGWSGAGKTSLASRLIPALAARGMAVATIKHAHHRFDVDVPGKDSWLHREAGARQVMVASANRWALMTELRGAPEPDLAFLLARLNPVDLVLIEGFKRDPHPKIEVHRAANAKPWLHPQDPAIVAIASDCPPPARPGGALPWVDLDDTDAIAALALHHARTPREIFGEAAPGAAQR